MDEDARRVVVFERNLELGEDNGWGRKQKENIREINVWRGGRQAQMIETLVSREDQTAASAFVSMRAGLSLLVSVSNGDRTMMIGA